MAAPSNYTPADYRHRDYVEIRRALLSVSDKTGLLELGKELAAAGVELVATGGTFLALKEANIPVIEVSELTGFPESLDGRVKTLHPHIHGGLLADMRLIEHEKQLAELGIAPFELVVVNLYPFAQTIKSGVAAEVAVDQIDIGGPTMVRAAAKNHANVTIVVDPAKYPEVIAAIKAGGTSLAQRREFAYAAFSHTALYDSAVANWFAAELENDWKRATGYKEGAETVNPGFEKNITVEAQLATILRYGENAHQAAALYRKVGEDAVVGIAQARQLGGKEMSYNNYVDADAALRAVYDFDEPAVAIVKHANPCGIAIGDPKAPDVIADAHAKAYICDSVSAFGGVVASNSPVTVAMANQVASIFTEVIIAPSYDIDALAILLDRKNLRILQLPPNYSREAFEYKQISGGLMIQEADQFSKFSSKGWKLVTGKQADFATRKELEFAWRACRSVKSNGILLARDGASVGVGMGQVNRADSCRLAVERAESRAKDAVAASDAFFPFADGLQILIDAGVRAVVQPGGSVRDEEVIAAAEAAGITMYFTGERHFFH